MKPETKAKELVDRFINLIQYDFISDLHWYDTRNNKYNDYVKKDAKKCALIIVDEILKDREIIDGMRVINDPYWLKVKQEIEKL
jgi:hypothetical protein